MKLYNFHKTTSTIEQKIIDGYSEGSMTGREIEHAHTVRTAVYGYIVRELTTLYKNSRYFVEKATEYHNEIKKSIDQMHQGYKGAFANKFKLDYTKALVCELDVKYSHRKKWENTGGEITEWECVGGAPATAEDGGFYVLTTDSGNIVAISKNPDLLFEWEYKKFWRLDARYPTLANPIPEEHPTYKRYEDAYKIFAKKSEIQDETEIENEPSTNTLGDFFNFDKLK